MENDKRLRVCNPGHLITKKMGMDRISNRPDTKYNKYQIGQIPNITNIISVRY